jgi:hypothetical protein
VVGVVWLFVQWIVLPGVLQDMRTFCIVAYVPPTGENVGCAACVGETTLMLSDCVAACGEVAESFACTLNVKPPDALAVPLMTPELESVNPGGNCPAARVQV